MCKHIYGFLEYAAGDVEKLNTPQSVEEAESGAYVACDPILFRYCPYCGQELRPCKHIYGLYHEEDGFVNMIRDANELGHLITNPRTKPNVEVFYVCPLCGEKLVEDSND